MINTWPGWENAGFIGEGSFGKVYRIRREEFGVVYESALKVITIPASQSDVKAAYAEGMDDVSVTKYFHSFVEDIVAEFALMSQLKGNSNIVSYEDHMVVPHEGEVGWDILIRMELLTALPDYVREHPLGEEDVIRLGIDMSRALELCQRRGIIHRDIKPENIFVSRDGDFKLGDFGVARVAEKTVSAMSRKGTYNYMAPEVYKGEKYGYAADIYSLGLVLYRFLNDNRVPFLPPYPTPIQYSDREKALDDRMTGQPLPEPAHGSSRLKEIVQKACAYRPEDRYGSAEEMKNALEELVKKPEVLSAGTTVNKRGGRRILIGLAAVILVMAAVAAVKGLTGRLSGLKEQKTVEAMLDQPADAEQLQERAAQKAAFDQRLAGSWYRYDTVYEGETKLTFSGISELIILETGEYYLGSANTYAELGRAGLSLPRMTVNGNQLNWLESYRETYSNITNYKNDSLFSIYEALGNLQVTYEIFDCEVNPYNETSSFNAYFAAYPDDGLAIHISAEYTESSFSVKTIDQTLYFYRNYPLNRDKYFLPSLEGRWEDTLGNVWAFQLNKKEADSGFIVTFAMKDTEGTVHIGTRISKNYDTDDCVETIQFRFEDNLAIPEYTITDYDGDTLSLVDEKGNELILTRK